MRNVRNVQDAKSERDVRRKDTEMSRLLKTMCFQTVRDVLEA